MSAPAAKARSLPVTIMQRTSVPRSQVSSASASSLSSAELRAFNASGRFRVAIPTEPFTSVLMFICASCLAFWTIEGRTPGLDNALHCPGALVFTRQAFTSIDQKVMLEIAGVAGGLGVIAQGRSTGGDRILQHFLDRGYQGHDLLALERTRQPFGRDVAAEQRLADIDVAQARHHPLVQQRRLDRRLLPVQRPGQMIGVETVRQRLDADILE